MKSITHYLALAIAAIWGFALTPAGQALLKQYPRAAAIWAGVSGLLALYYSPKTVKPLLAVLLALAFLSSPLAAQTKPAKQAVKHAATSSVRHHALFRLIVKGPYTGWKGFEYSFLFTGEVIIDGARIGLTGADTVFDVLSIEGKVPVLDSIYAGIGVGAKDAAWLDVHDEALEQSIFGTHN